MFTCSKCNYTTQRKYNLDRHTKLVHKEDNNASSHTVDDTTTIVDISPHIVDNLPINVDNSPQKNDEDSESESGKCFKCNDCYKSFTTKYRLTTHHSKCPKIHSPLACPKCLRIFSDRSAKHRHIKICKHGAVTIPTDTTTTVTPIQQQIITQNNNNINNIQNNIQTQNVTQNNYTIVVNPFGQERDDYITDEFKDMCIRSVNGAGVRLMVEKTHFNPDVPENHNIRLRSTKQQQLSVYDGQRWKITDKNEIIENILSKTCAKLIKHYNESPIRDEDINQHHNLLIQNLMAIGTKIPSLYHPVKRQIFAMICDLSMQLIDEQPTQQGDNANVADMVIPV